MYASPIVRPAMGNALTLEQQFLLNANEFLDVSVKME